MKTSRFFFLITVLIVLLGVIEVRCQGDGPRAHLLSPTGVWAINPKYLNLDQNFLPAGDILVSGANFKVNVFPTTLVHTFGIKNKMARVFFMLNPGNATGSIDLEDSSFSRSLSASGFSDGFVAFEFGIIGAPKLSVLDFAKKNPEFTLMGYAQFWYSGSYDSSNLLNLGTNRSAFELGTTMAIPLHKTYDQNNTWVEVFPTIKFFTDNNDPARSSRAQRIEQEPLFSLETHLTHNFTKKFWAGVDLRYQFGGETSADGISDENRINLIGGGLSAGYQLLAPLSIYAGYGSILYGDNEARSDMIRLSLVFSYINMKKSR
jgi:hypothetical protein